MSINRRDFLAAGSAVLATAAAPRAFARSAPWNPNPLFMAASTSVYSLYVNTQGVPGG